MVGSGALRAPLEKAQGLVVSEPYLRGSSCELRLLGCHALEWQGWHWRVWVGSRRYMGLVCQELGQWGLGWGREAAGSEVAATS